MTIDSAALATLAALLPVLGRQTLVLAIGVLLLTVLRPLLRRLGAAAGYTAWLALPAMLVAAELPHTPAAAVTAWAAPLMAGRQELAELLPSPARDGGIGPVLASVWLIGALAVTGVFALRQHRFSRQLQRPSGDPYWRLPASVGPATVGLWPGRIALPADFEQRFDADERTLILAHEQVHLRRHDNAWSLLALGLAVLHWFNPLAWWALRRLRVDQELSCDAAVLARHPRPRAYARALLKSASSAGAPAVLASAWQSPHPLIERIQMLQQAPLTPWRRRLSQVLAGLLVAGAGFAAYAAQNETPQAGAPAQPVTPQVFLDLKVTLDGKPAGKPRLMTALATPASVGWNLGPQGRPGADSWFLHVTPNAHAPGQIELTTQILRGEDQALQAEPRLIVHEGQPGRIEFSSRDGLHTLSLEVRASYVQVPEGMTAQDAFRQMLANSTRPPKP